jgi:predicted acetylornithine/succinylornithine family transaminase
MTSNAEVVQLTNKYLIANYGRLPVAMARAEGSRVWDADGKEYLDFFAGFGATGAVGHCHPVVVAALREQAGKLLCVGNLFSNEPQAELAKALFEKGFGGQSFFCHSGAEANEAALKLARLYAGNGRYKIISFHNCFHGRTMGALSLTPEKFQKGFEPMLPGSVKATLNDLASVQAAIDKDTAGIIVEPIQGEGGMNMPTVEFMQGLRKLCDQHKIAFMVDEVWTAPARTGKWFAYQHYGIEPDIMSLGKALGGGVPMAACVAKPELAKLMSPGKHGCTLGGNPLCAAAGAAVMKVIEQEKLVEAAVAKGKVIVDALKAAKLAKVKDIRGKGLMIGIELTVPGKDAFMATMEKGLLINCTQDTVLRLAPPLTIANAQIEQGLAILIEVLRK